MDMSDVVIEVGADTEEIKISASLYHESILFSRIWTLVKDRDRLSNVAE